MKGITIWLFSKIVMFIFLIMTFATVISYMNLLSQKISIDTADVVTESIKSSMQAEVLSSALDAQTNVAIPSTIPQRTVEHKSGLGELRYRPYSIQFSTGSAAAGGVTKKYVSIALGWGKDAATFVASSFLFIDKDVQINIPAANYQVYSLDKSFVNIRVCVDNTNKKHICVAGCVSAASGCDNTVCDTKCL